MTQHKHLFVMDSVEKLNLKLDSSLRVAQALINRGHQCYMTSPQEMTWLNGKDGSTPYCTASLLSNDNGEIPSIKPLGQLELSEFDGIHMRKDPPFDMDYISSTWVLSEAGKKSKIYNDPQTLRGMNEKLAIFAFPQYCDTGILSSNPTELTNFVKKEASGDAILKPLDLYGGRGVQRISLQSMTDHDLEVLLDSETGGGKAARLIQPFNKGIFEGEVRAFTCFGEAISWCLKIPAKGEYLANTRTGATLHAYTPPKEELEMVLDVSSQLRKQGVEFVGYDIIGGKISEINITSPRLLLADDQDPTAYYDRIAHLLEQDLPS